MTIQEVTTSEELELLRPRWNELLARSEQECPFLTHEWMSAWWRHFGQGRRLFVLVVKEGPEIIGIAPWAISCVGNGRTIFRKVGFLATGLSDQLDCILPGRGDGQIEALLAHLLARKRIWDIADFCPIVETSKTLPGFRRGIAEHHLHHTIEADSVSPYLPLNGDWTRFFEAKFSRNRRWQLQRKERKLSEQGAVTIRHLQCLAQDDGLLDRMAAMPQTSVYRGKERVGLMADSQKNGFYREISEVFSKSGWLRISALELGDRLAAYRFGFSFKGRHYDYFHGFDPAMAFASPGTSLLVDVLRQCFENHVTEFDFLRGSEPYKFYWTDQVRQNLRVRFFSPSLRGGLLRAVYALRDHMAACRPNPTIQPVPEEATG